MDGAIKRRLVNLLDLPDEVVCEVRNYLVSHEGGRILPSASAIHLAMKIVSRTIPFKSSLWEIEWRTTFVRYMWKYLIDIDRSELFDKKTVSMVMNQIARCEKKGECFPQDPSLWFCGQHYRMIYSSGKWKIKKLSDWSDSDYRRNGVLPSWVINETGWQWPIVNDEYFEAS